MKKQEVSRVASREPRLNFTEVSGRGRTSGSTRGIGSSTTNPKGSHISANPTNGHRGGSTDNMPAWTNQLMRNARASGRLDSSGLNHSNPGRAQKSDSGRRSSRASNE